MTDEPESCPDRDPDPQPLELGAAVLIDCPTCGGPLVLTLPIGEVERYEAAGVSEAEMRDRVLAGLAEHRITCGRCARGRADTLRPLRSRWADRGHIRRAKTNFASGSKP